MLDQAQQKWGNAMQGYEALLRQQPGDFRKCDLGLVPGCPAS